MNGPSISVRSYELGWVVGRYSSASSSSLLYGFVTQSMPIPLPLQPGVISNSSVMTSQLWFSWNYGYIWPIKPSSSAARVALQALFCSTQLPLLDRQKYAGDDSVPCNDSTQTLIACFLGEIRHPTPWLFSTCRPIDYSHYLTYELLLIRRTFSFHDFKFEVLH